ncbi:basic helix-loop-helix (bHLH) DNA-binding superfamily protein [Arabidopsis thaliana]|uniref:Basic helix-loop-helix (BHLH) DNA-binding superfamily protein n=1 Tax=Arabidopsis thaliana TaxID=3702 RepID=A0A1P8B4W7_ARATH|nr:basic helix-loop-helix (bHLH) DNA-binding superfamily protein [Arabidopsis thaliana]ANM66645.1 basic helix-loop-helix (bHLH) DNA-binding superfamily protein [Arabidopsis thaliana]|eukprot:NP_001328529.1 basic helix-loop-helix (bHLH) DNA-binding superfamily protein [Arabidopsis thaliana]
MNRGVLESSPVQQLMAAGNPNWWNVSGGMRPPPPLMGHQQAPLPPHMTPNNNYLRPRMMPTPFPHFLPSPATSSSSSSSSPSLPNNPNLSSWLESNDLPPESWSLSQLLLGGLMMGEEERLEMMNHHNHHDEQQHHGFQGKIRLENWEEQVLSHQQASMVAVDIKQEGNINNNNGYVISSPNSPPNKSCVTTTTTTSLNSNDDNINNNNNMLDFSSNHNGLHLSEGRHTPPDRSSECNSLEIGGSTNKKPRLQPSPSSQSTLKVRKEKLGGRIAALHQLVSPFGKTDTASVLSEAIGYIRFLQSQIEALSHPYFGTTASGNMRHQQHLQGDRSCIFPEDPGQVRPFFLGHYTFNI